MSTHTPKSKEDKLIKSIIHRLNIHNYNKMRIELVKMMRQGKYVSDYFLDKYNLVREGELK